MKVFIAGVDGYLGWPLAQYLSERGHQIAGIDMLLRRHWVEEVGGHSAIPIYSLDERLRAFKEAYGQELIFRQGNMLDYALIKDFLREFQPDAVIHLAEMPSAAYSMMDQEHAAFTQHNNVIGSLNLLWAIKEVCPHAHLVKLGTMGEYGTPNIDIPEGFFEVEFRGRKDYLPFPRQAGSFYHWSKVHDSNNTMFACRTWGLRATDIMQGVVFGTHVAGIPDDLRLRSRLDFDQCFGTVINRFCCQTVIDHPLTIYGEGNQTRSFIPLCDSMQCLAITIENPPVTGQYRVFNQFERTISIRSLARLVQAAGHELDLVVELQEIDNPRTEQMQHYFNPDRNHLSRLGYQPSTNIKQHIRLMIYDLMSFKERILAKSHLLIPDIRWDGTRQRSTPIAEQSTVVH